MPTSLEENICNAAKCLKILISRSPAGHFHAKQLQAAISDLLPGEMSWHSPLKDMVGKPIFKQLAMCGPPATKSALAQSLLSETKEIYSDRVQEVLELFIAEFAKDGEGVQEPEQAAQTFESSNYFELAKGSGYSQVNSVEVGTPFARLDTIYDIHISSQEAAKGHERKLLINNRSYDVRLPKNLSNQQLVRMKGLGNSQGATKGDLYLRANIVLPGKSGEEWWAMHLNALHQRGARNYGP